MARPRKPVRSTPDQAAMQSAIQDFLRAAGLDPATHPDLAGTPELVSRAWAEEFLAGYQTDPRQVLAERMPAPEGSCEMVVLAGLTYESACPHHLLPYGGVAHVAYLPGKFVIGFGQIVHLLDCLGHRLILQEELARGVADALSTIIGARGAAVILEAEQSCLALRGGRRAGSKVIAEAWSGVFETDAELRARFLGAVRKD